MIYILFNTEDYYVEDIIGVYSSMSGAEKKREELIIERRKEWKERYPDRELSLNWFQHDYDIREYEVCY